MILHISVKRDEILHQLLQLLRLGLTDGAIRFLDQIPKDDLKSVKEWDTLKDYLERNKPLIPCYALRKELGLRNSSEIGEKHNDLVVSGRQKHKGMSWSKEGSTNLAILKTLPINKELGLWLRKKDLSFKIAA